jgi:3-oxoacyl-[acyl-carrier protein] reductase
VALGLAAEGGRVVVNDIDADVAEGVVAEIRKAGGQAVAAPASVTDRAAVEGVVQRAVDEWGTLDILVNNAGILRDATIIRMTDEQWDAVIDTHLRGTFYFLRAAGAVFREKAQTESEVVSLGKVVNVSSRAALRGNLGQANYAAAKAGIIALTMVAAREWARYKVNVNCVAFGMMETRLTESVRADARMVEQYQRDIALGRYGTTKEAADPILFLCSEAANYITAELMNVTGGGHIAL